MVRSKKAWRIPLPDLGEEIEGMKDEFSDMEKASFEDLGRCLDDEG